jgi:hypothetical protein
MFDAYTARAQLNPGNELSELDADVGYGNNPANSANLGIVTPGGKNLPYPVGYGPGGDAARFLDQSIIGSHVLVEDYNKNKESLNQFKLEGTWSDETLKFKYGVQYTHDHEQLRSFTDLPYTWQMYAGYGPAPVSASARAHTVKPDPRVPSARVGFHQGSATAANLPASIMLANGNAIKYLEGLNGAGMNGATVPTRTPGPAPRLAPAITSMYENLGNHQDITENTVSPYLNLQTKAKLADMPLNINVGLRFEDTYVDSAGVSSANGRAVLFCATDPTAYGFSSTPPSRDQRQERVPVLCRTSI